jgi:hypothetical protein
MGTTGDVVKGILFLASTDAEFITGIDLVIDGGIRYNWPASFRHSQISKPKQTEEPKNVTEHRILNSKFSKVELNPWRELNAISTNSSFTKPGLSVREKVVPIHLNHSRPSHPPR